MSVDSSLVESYWEKRDRLDAQHRDECRTCRRVERCDECAEGIGYADTERPPAFVVST